MWGEPTPRLAGELVVLEPLVEAHAEGLRAASGDADGWRWLDRRVPEDDGAFRGWFEAALAAGRAGTEKVWATVRRRDARIVGSTRFLALRPEDRALEIGWTWLEHGARGTGVNAEAKLLQLGYAFDGLGCVRVDFKTDARNERSRAALTRLGAQFEGVFRKHRIVPGVGQRDSAYFSVLDDEWPTVRRDLEARVRAAAGDPPRR